MDAEFIVALCAAVAGAVTIALLVGRRYRPFRATRLVVCPDDCATAAVELDATHALWSSITRDRPELRLDNCSRWPDKESCGAPCLGQIERAPDDCMLRAIVARWYAGRRCALCHKPFEGIESFGHKTALLGPDGVSLEWGDVRGESLPAVFATHQPLCWNCHVAETFRRVRPELVTDREHVHSHA
jgi:hypothetical protein